MFEGIDLLDALSESIEDAGSLVVLPTVGGFLFAFYLSIGELFA